MDALRQLADLVERLNDVGPQFAEETGRSLRIRLDEPAGDLQVDGDGDQLLLDAVVQAALERAPLVVVCEEECAQRVHMTVLRYSGRAVKVATTVGN
jgi:hypothetical protein